MRVIARSSLIEFYTKHPESKASLETWFHVAKSAKWEKPLDVAGTFSSAKVVSNDRIRFKIRGNDYRLIVAFDFEREIAFIKFIGTHADYDKIDAATVSSY
ncbi:type II toxin-antitoxin system HigB family toxin [Cognatishimia maritima]|uniref:mRNA interferase HigB n=1 Tax=Cognatishimia maritima TaxID=870908 RepID=A0A1M5P999_9RHOB|nr:type II toxin-antitoxin system HigB family toxin [Cognatishimia maritima]SHG98348.1 mRNA interferase HigB [Cognatishimia maritima]